MSAAEGGRYAQEIEKLPFYRQQKILADAEGKIDNGLKEVFNHNGVYAACLLVSTGQADRC
jgi:hypothetical protein